jgi:hypothetical protein
VTKRRRRRTVPAAIDGSTRERLVRAAREVLERCACEHGCPACIGPLEEVGPLGKATALGVLAFLERGPDFVPGELPPVPTT